MTSKIKVDNINKVSDDSNIIKKCGTTITLGASGDSIALASGASQTGFGRTGTVDWDTTPKTATFSAVSGNGYFCNTSGGAFTVNLPAGSAGAIVSVQDYNNTFDSNNLTIDPNGSEKINGGDAGIAITLSTEGQGLTLVYVDGTVGWRSVHSDDFSQVPLAPAFVAASGGTVTTCGNFKVHTFTSPGTFTVSDAGNSEGSNTIDYLVVAGGGGSGADAGGGSGGGGLRFSNSTFTNSGPSSPRNGGTALPVTATGYPVTVGGGGAGTPDGNAGAPGTKGTDSSFAGSSTITSTGGGFGGGVVPGVVGGPGGSGGGGRSNEPPG